MHSRERGWSVAAIEAVLRDVAEAVGAHGPAHALVVEAVGDELGPRREVDAVEAGPAHGRARDADVHLERAGLAQHPDERALGVAADDRVVDDDEALAPDDLAQRVELEPDAQLADGLRGLDERAAHVGVLDQALAVGDAGALGVADRRRGPGLGHGDDEVRVGRVLVGETAPDLDARRVHATAGDRGVRAGEVDVLEDAALGLRRGEPRAAQALGVDGDELAGLDLADERRPDDVEGGGLGGDDPAAVETAQHERAHAVAVAGGVERGLVAEGDAEGALQVGQQAQRRLLDPQVGRRVGEQARHDVGVGGGADEGRRAPVAAAVAVARAAVHREGGVAAPHQLGGVDEVAVVPQREAGAGRGGAERRLGVLPGGGARRRVPGVAHGEVAAQGRERLLVEDLADQPEVLEDHDLATVADGHARGLLAAVLQGEEPEVGELRDLLAGRPDAEDAALLLGPLVVRGGLGGCRGG